MMLQDHPWSRLAKRSAVLALALPLGVAQACLGQAANSALWPCENQLYAPARGDYRGGYVTRARSDHRTMNSDAAEYAAAVNDVKQNFFNAENEIGCQTVLWASVNFSQAKAVEYKRVFARFKEKTQNLQQSGGNAASSGTTNLVSKGLTSEVLSLASEYGGLTQSTSGQTTTISASLSSIPLSLGSKSGAPLFADCADALPGTSCLSKKRLDWLSKFSFSAGVNTGGGTTGTGMTTGTMQGSSQPVKLSDDKSASNYSLNQVTAKFAILRQLPTAATLSKSVRGMDKSVLEQVDKQVSSLYAYLSPIDKSVDPAVLSKLQSAAEVLLDAGTTSDEQDKAWQKAAQLFVAALENAASKKIIKPDYANTFGDFLVAAAQHSALEDIAYYGGIKPTLSVEYDLNTPGNQPTNSVFKVISSWVPKNWTNLTLTFNGAASIYNGQISTSVPSASRLRDIQISAEGDYKLPSLPVLGQPTLTGAFYYQDQTSPSILKVPIAGLPITGLSSSTNNVFTTRGPIDIGQVKISFGKSSSGVSVPLSVTIANRTELLTGMDVRGQIGISYDFSSLLSK